MIFEKVKWFSSGKKKLKKFPGWTLTFKRVQPL